MSTLEDGTSCTRCGRSVPERLLSCGSCGALVHAPALKELADRATEAEAGEHLGEALARWRDALELLPADTKQHATISERVDKLSRRVSAGEGKTPEKKTGIPYGKAAAGLGAGALLLWKFKGLLAVLLTKGKLLLLGLTKLGTLSSMVLSLGVYWTVWGWQFALGFIVSIYVHEMGHVAALSRFGVAASAPMFIPGFGALVRLKQGLANAHEDARVGLAGPLWGMAFAAAVALLSLGVGWGGGAAIAQWAAVINLFNLMPVWQLDGARGFASLGRLQRGAVSVCALVLGVLTLAPPEAADAGQAPTSLCLLAVGILGAFKTFMGEPHEEGDWPMAALFLALLGSLALIGQVPVTVPPGS